MLKQCEVVKKIGDMLIVKLYAGNEKSRVYGDVHKHKTLLAGKNNTIFFKNMVLLMKKSICQ